MDVVCIKCQCPFTAAGPRRKVCPACKSKARQQAVRDYDRSLALDNGEIGGASLKSLYYLAIKSQEEVARILGVTRQMVQRTERRAIFKIRQAVKQPPKRKPDGAAEAIERYERFLVRWSRRTRRLLLSNCCHGEVRDIILTLEQARRALQSAREEIG